MKTALIFGVTGQDGYYLAMHLRSIGYRVIGTSRYGDENRMNRTFQILKEQIKIISVSIIDFRSVMQAVSTIAPDEVYNLAGQTSVGVSYDQPVETLESIITGTLNILECLRLVAPKAKFYNAGSSECFGDTGNQAATETTLFKPLSPYAVAKACSTNLVSSYRKSYNLFCCTGILFNHESPIRSNRFVTKKIVEAAYKVKIGSIQSIQLGNIDIYRDWGWSPDYVKVMHLMLTRDEPLDFLIATGKSVSLADFINMAFSYFNLNWQNHIVIENDLMRPSDIKYSAGDPSLANSILSLDPFHKVEAVIAMMCSHLENSGA